MSGSFLLIILGRPEHRVLFNQALQSSSHRLIFANDGEDGFDRFNEAKPDVVITHVSAPKLDATILCPLIRQHSVSVPVFLYGEEPIDRATARAKVEAIGANGYIPLPFDDQALVAMIQPYVEAAGDQTMDDLPAVPAEASTDLDHASDTDFEITLDADDGDEVLMDPALMAAARAEDLVHDIDTGPVTPPVDLLIEPISGVGRTPVPLTPPVDMLEEGIAVVGRTPLPLAAPGDMLEEPMAPVQQMPADQARESAPFYVLPVELAPAHDSGSLGLAMHIEVVEPSMPADLLEEPVLPVRAQIEAKPVSGSARSPMHDRMIREMPKDATPTAGTPEVVANSAQSRRGLDESQLGKRLAGRVRKIYGVLDELDYYQLLGVELTADAKALRDSYFELSLEFHPDRFFLLRSGDLKEKIYAVYRRISEAYAVLGDPRRRATYDDARQTQDVKRAPAELRELKRSDAIPIEVSSAPATHTFDVQLQSEAAQLLVARAHNLFEQEDFNGARLFLTFALAYEPESARLRQAITEVARTRRRPG